MTAPTINTGAIPLDLANRAQWLVWKFEPGDKKPKKMPYYASGKRRTGVQGSDVDRSALVSMSTAHAASLAGYSGIGFAFLPGDGLIGIDIDGCIDADGVANERSAAIIAACDSYTELSPSGMGVHIIVAGESNTFKSNDIGLEVFCGRQFFTFTAQPMVGTPAVVNPIDAGVLNRLRATVQQAKTGAAPASAARTSPVLVPMTDERAKLESALTCVNADCGYDEWFKVGMGIFDALGETGFPVWDYWSSKSGKYPGSDQLAQKWKSFKAGGGVTAASIFKIAVDAGWRPPRSAPIRLPAPILAVAQSGNAESLVSPVADATLVTGLVSLEWCIAHCALIQGSTDVWDALNKLRVKKSAFIDMSGKDVAKAWLAHPDKRSISPRNLPKIVRGVASDNGGAGADNIVMMLDRYVLLYGTKTVWDADKKVVLGYDAMQLARGELATRWIEHPLRREVDHANLVFDPTQKVDLATHINMFEGFPLVPKVDEELAALVLDLLYSLCMSEENCDEVYQWVIKWLAYPLQRPGAKMQTALLFFGEKQGTGKSLFFEGLMKPIYGAHGATGGQHQLEGTYSMWRSQKMYVLFEEILSRQDKYSHFGLIKHMITGRDTSISQKFRDDRVEANHLNVVMLSNEFQAVPIEPEDRRFLVVNVLQPLDDALLAKINQYPPHQLSEAFYAFLLAYPLDGYTPHTKPLMTASKARVINFGRPDWESFYLSWAAGDLAAPYCSCMTLDLYLAYKRHCTKYGFRQIGENKFSELIAQRVRKDRQWVEIGAAQKKLLTLFIVPPTDDALPESYSAQCNRFRKLADILDVA